MLTDPEGDYASYAPVLYWSVIVWNTLEADSIPNSVAPWITLGNTTHFPFFKPQI